MKNGFKVQSSRVKVQSATRNIEHKTWNPEHTAGAWALGIVLALMPAVALAQAMSDPTRPPTGYAEADAGTAASGLVLQSVMISPTLKAVIINGEMVKLGEKFGSARLVKITESEVVLKDGEESQVLKLYPGVEKRAVEKPEARTAAKRRK